MSKTEYLQTKKVEFRGRKVMVRELTALEVQKFYDGEDLSDLGLLTLRDPLFMAGQFKDMLQLSDEEAGSLTANEYARLVSAFEECNADFLARLPAEISRLNAMNRQFGEAVPGSAGKKPGPSKTRSAG